MRKSTLLWLTLAAFSGTALFHTSQKVHDERAKIAALDENIGKEEESIRVLNTEWSYLNQPARLESLAKTHLGMAPMKGSEFVKVEDIPLRSTTPPPEATASLETSPAEIKVTEKKPAVENVAKAPAQKPVIRFQKPVETVTLQKPAPHKAPAVKATASNGRTFGDLMKSLKTGNE